MLDIIKLRDETPGLGQRLYFDNAGASLPPFVVNEAIKAHLDLEAARGGYVAQFDVADRLEAVYGFLAKLLGGQPKNYALTSSAVDSWNTAFMSVPLEAGDNIVTCFNEYCSNFVAILHRQKQAGFDIRVVGADETGALNIAELESLIDDKTKIVSATGISSSSGQIIDMKAVGEVTRRNDVLYLLDACQAVGQTPVNVIEVGADMVVGTSRKFLRGPRGVGFLYLSDKALKKLSPHVLTNNSAVWTARDKMEYRTDARLFEAWERSVALQLGFGAALEYMLAHGAEALMAQACAVAAYAREKLDAIVGITVMDQPGPRGAIVTFLKADEPADAVKERLDVNGIAVNVASVVHTRLDLEARGIDALVRISPQYYTTHEDVDRLIDAILEG